MNLFDVYPLFDIEIVSGRGCTVCDSEGKEYLDLYGGHAVISVGHSHPRFVETIQQQASKLVFYSNSVINGLQKTVAEKLGELSGYPDYSLFLINSGAEANENALKLASFKTGRKRIIAFHKAFHGRTSAAVEATDNEAIKAPVNRSGNVTFLPLDDIQAVEEELRKDDVAAVIIEGIQGVGGIRIPHHDFLRQLRDLTEKHGTILILDEVQSGYGRTGRFFAHQWAGIRPDLITVGKGIANGIPMAGLLISPRFIPSYGQLGTTFGGNHLACAGAIAVLDIIREEKLIDNALCTGNYLLEKLGSMEGIENVRGCGLMIGFDVPQGASQLRKELIYGQRVFTGASDKNTVRLLPPLVLSREEADIFIERLQNALETK